MTLELFTQDESIVYRNHLEEIEGPVLVLGTGGFIGVHLGASLQEVRDDVFLGSRSVGNWRSQAVGLQNEIQCDVSDETQITRWLDGIKPKTIINATAYGAYPHQSEILPQLMVNVGAVSYLAEWSTQNDCVLIHLGSSSEYGTNSSGPQENSRPVANSYYSVTKFAGSQVLTYLSASGLIGACLRLYSVYGPLEDPRRLMPTLVRLGSEKRLPKFSPRDVTRDFIYITDVLSVVASAAVNARSTRTFEIFNVGTGVATSMMDIAQVGSSVFGVEEAPQFQAPMRSWDLSDWFADPTYTRARLGWKHQVAVSDGLRRMSEWYQIDSRFRFLQEGIEAAPREKAKKISAIVACYKDEQAIPIMYERLKRVINETGCEYEIIFVNDASPDNSLNVIREISKTDPKVLGVSHSRNFGSQAAFLSGLLVSSGDHCCLLDGDLQDPPELIQTMLSKLEQEQADVVYGQRVSRAAPFFMRAAYKAFYRILHYLSPYSIPVDAGDFSLMTRRVVDDLLVFPERDLFLRTQRAYVGRKQVSVPYHRPERMFGTSTNNLVKNFRWAIKGVVSASSKPLSILGATGLTLFALSVFGVLVQLGWRTLSPESAPPGIVTLIVLIASFGSLNLVAISVVGEYVGRILDEVRGRPRFIRTSLVKSGEIVESQFRG